MVLIVVVVLGVVNGVVGVIRSAFGVIPVKKTYDCNILDTILGHKVARKYSTC